MNCRPTVFGTFVSKLFCRGLVSLVLLLLDPCFIQLAILIWVTHTPSWLATVGFQSLQECAVVNKMPQIRHTEYNFRDLFFH